MKYWWYMFRWWLVEKLPITTKAPLHVDIELTNNCNLGCKMCPHGDEAWKPVKGMMPRETALDLIDQCAENGVPSIKLQFRGESALHPNLVEIIRYAKDKGIVDVRLNTNAIPYTEEKAFQMVQAGLDMLIVSIDGATEETYSLIRGADLWRVERTLAWFHRAKVIHRSSLWIRIQMTQQDENDSEIQSFRKRFENLADEIHIKPVRSRNTGKRKRCAQPYQRVVFGWDGKNYACCHAWNDESYIGHSWDVMTAWKNAGRFRQMAKHPEKQEPCKSCQIGASYR